MTSTARGSWGSYQDDDRDWKQRMDDAYRFADLNDEPYNNADETAIQMILAGAEHVAREGRDAASVVRALDTEAAMSRVQDFSHRSPTPGIFHAFWHLMGLAEEAPAGSAVEAALVAKVPEYFKRLKNAIGDEQALNTLSHFARNDPYAARVIGAAARQVLANPDGVLPSATPPVSDSAPVILERLRKRHKPFHL